MIDSIVKSITYPDISGHNLRSIPGKELVKA